MHVVVASHHRLPVEGYGGPQRVVVALVRGLAALGHRVTLLAQPGTKVPEAAKTVEVAPRLLKDSGVDLKKFIPEGADILHAHFSLKQGPKGVPFVQTLHGNWKPDIPLPPNTIFLSRDHAKRHGSTIFVHNGLDPAEYIFRGRKEQWDLFLGKLHSDRGYHWAVDAAKRTGRRLIIAGGTRGDVATREVYSFDPAHDQVHQIGMLPRELTHAAGAALGNWMYVIGGRGTDQGTQTSAILAVDPVSGRVEPAGRLPVGLSDLGAATIGGAVVVAGGRQSDGVLSNRLYALRPQVGAR